jgi:SH2 domain
MLDCRFFAAFFMHFQEEFEDLDEIQARYIGGLNEHVQDIISHSKYRKERRLEVLYPL